MLTFKELNNIAKTNRPTHSVCLPQDCFELARNLNLRIKNSAECKQDFPDKNPLCSNNAIYALFKGEYTIYYDEKYAYKNFAVAHEIAHHLLQHENDGVAQHHDANLLAAILVAPKESIIKNRIRNEVELSEKYIIPIDVAQNYWKHITAKKRKKYWLYALLAILTITTFACIGYTVISKNRQNYSNSDIGIAQTRSVDINKENITSDICVTASGTKYHKASCFHIKNKTNTINLSVEEALKIGYEPCKDCIEP